MKEKLSNETAMINKSIFLNMGPDFNFNLNDSHVCAGCEPDYSANKLYSVGLKKFSNLLTIVLLK